MEYFTKSKIKNIEEIVCDVVFHHLRACDGEIALQTIYLSKTNVTIPIRIARGAIFVCCHDKFGISYKELSIHSRFTCTSIMRIVRTYKNLLETDAEIKQLHEKIIAKMEGQFGVIKNDKRDE